MQMTDELFDWRLDSGMHTWKVSPDQCYVFFPDFYHIFSTLQMHYCLKNEYFIISARMHSIDQKYSKLYLYIFFYKYIIKFGQTLLKSPHY